MNKLLILCVLITGSAFGQGARFDSNVTTVASNVPAGAKANVMTLPNAIVSICGSPVSGSPCTNLVPIYGDSALTTPAQNPITADNQGRFGFWIAPGNYAYSVQTPGGTWVGDYSINVSLPIITASSFPGSDIGAQINNAQASLGALGGTVKIPASPTCYQFSTPIIELPNVVITGDGVKNTCIQWTPSGGTAFKAAAYGGFNNLSLIGTPSATTSIGIDMTGAHEFASYNLMLGNVDDATGLVYNKFHLGMTFGNNSYDDTFVNAQIWQNDQNIFFPSGLTNAGENIKFISGTITNGRTFANCFQSGTPGTANNAEFILVGTSLDSCQLVNNEGIVRGYGLHIEDGLLAISQPYVVTQSSNITGTLGSFGTFLAGTRVYSDQVNTYSAAFEIQKYGALYIDGYIEGGNAPGLPIFQFTPGTGGGNGPSLKFKDSQNQRTAASMYTIASTVTPFFDIETPRVHTSPLYNNAVFPQTNVSAIYGQGSAVVFNGSEIGSYFWSGVGALWDGVRLRANVNGTGFVQCGAGAFTFAGYDSFGSEAATCTPIPIGPSSSTPNHVVTYSGITGQQQDSGLDIANICQTGGTSCPSMVLRRIFTTSTTTTETVTLTGITTNSVCAFGAKDTTAAANIATAFVGTYAAGSFTFTHAATAGMMYGFVCTPN